jgi:hypothetical protein
LENAFDRLKLAELCQLKWLKPTCAAMISANFEDQKQMPEWIELEKNWPELALYVQQSESRDGYDYEDEDKDKEEDKGKEEGGSSRGP